MIKHVSHQQRAEWAFHGESRPQPLKRIAPGGRAEKTMRQTSVHGSHSGCTPLLDAREQEAVDDVGRDQLLDESVLGSIVADHCRVVSLWMLLHDSIHGTLHCLIVVPREGSVLHTDGHHPDSELRVEFEDGFLAKWHWLIPALQHHGRPYRSSQTNWRLMAELWAPRHPWSLALLRLPHGYGGEQEKKTLD